MRSLKYHFVAGAAVCAMLQSNPALAQDAEDAAEAAPDGNAIIVTARRQSEQLQDVPASVAVITADALAKTGADTAEDFVQLTPGVTLAGPSGEGRASVRLCARQIDGVEDEFERAESLPAKLRPDAE